jgi:hypothetical protein
MPLRQSSCGLTNARTQKWSSKDSDGNAPLVETSHQRSQRERDQKENHAMNEAPAEKIEIETKPKGPALEYSASANKHSENRTANKQKKKAAHKRNLRRSNTNG